jgi:plastocyanin
MIFKSLVLVVLLSASVSADVNALRASKAIEDESLHLDLEVVVGGERQLFPLLPGTKCPTGHHCRVRNTRAGMNPMMSSLKDNLKTPLAATLDWQELNNNLNTVVASNDYCSRRSAMARAAGLAAGVAVATVSSPAYAAETKDVKMGSDSGQLVFVPAKVTVCAGDSIKWTNNKGGPHNVVFDEDDIPAGVDQEKISMDDQLGEEGDTFTMKLDKPGTYGYYCEPHRGAGMTAQVIVQ